MLRSEFPFRTETWPLRLLVFVLQESFLGFLAIVACALTLFPMLFDVAPATDAAIEICQWAIIALFALEYGLALAWTSNRAAFLRDPWRWLDLFTIVVPLATLLPTVSGALRSTPILRLVRLVRVATMGMRLGGVVARAEKRRAVASETQGPARVTMLRAAENPAGRADVAWNEFLQWVRRPGPEWYHVSSPAAPEIAAIAEAAGVPVSLLEMHLLGSGYPRVEASGRFAGLFVWLPEIGADGQIVRRAMYLVVGHDSLLSFSRHSTSLLNWVRTESTGDESEGRPFAGRMTRLFLRAVLAANERIVDSFEHELHTLEEVPVRESRPQFFERTFRLKKELSAARADLWRLKGLLSELAEGRARLPGAGEEEADDYRRLVEDGEFLFETIVSTREEVLSLIDLHLNIVSFDMNRVMRVLAVISALGLVPTVAGGLFGMNLIGNPWPFTLGQVAFSVSLGMVVAFYLFFIKGWLR
jgi:Mg2+ and Co2+ transporter CorA